MTIQAEAVLEENLIKDLLSNGYKRIKFKDENELEKNFKYQLEQHNSEKLLLCGVTEFTNNEFDKIMNHLSGGSKFEKAKKLRAGLDLILDNGEVCYISFINSDKWCQNLFQVSNQITILGMYENRYDVTILINGLPLVQIELKRKGMELKEAFNQICRYHRHSYNGLFQYLQLFVISNGVDTKYFSNNKELNYKQTFYWTDIENNKYSRLSEFTEHFLEKCHLSKMITKYIVLNETANALMVLRPYQYYAVEEIIKNVESNAMKNGYIWHTTGSGKTLTSFKASQILATHKDIDKVIFCVDRKDLDFNTMKEFESFSPGSVSSTRNTDQLYKQLKDTKTRILITTIQKLNNLVRNEKYLKGMESVKDKRMVFIFDECHRSQFGDSHHRINKYFTNKQFFGFTGTPIFAVNSIEGKTTQMLFGERLHSYIIKDAIADDNVLGFSVEYLRTFTNKDFIEEETGRDKDYDDIDVPGINKQEVFDSEERLELIVDHILKIHDFKTKNRHFTAMFTVSSVKNLIQYYDIFKRKDHNLKIATIFTNGANEDLSDIDGNFDTEGNPVSQAHSREKLDQYVKDYNKMFGENHDLNRFNGFNAYYVDISKKVKERKIDILLVVDMFLTGFDSVYLNTLYTDKNLRYHGLIQAYSRTNRILNDLKSFGNIVNFRNLYKKTNEAIELFSDSNAVEAVLWKTYEEYVEQTNQQIRELLDFIASPDEVNQLQSEAQKAEFVRLFRNVVRGINILDSFVDFSFNDLIINDELFVEYKSKYFEIYDLIKSRETGKAESILSDIDFEIALLRKDHINVDYILNLLGNLNSGSENFEKEIKFILKQMDTENLRSKKELIEEFIHATNFTEGCAIDEEFELYMNAKKVEVLAQIVVENNLKEDVFKKIISDYEYSQKINKPLIKKSLNELIPGVDMFDGESHLKARRRKINEIIDIIKNFVEKFTW